MSDWQPGDLALCVNTAPICSRNTHHTRLKVGRVYDVAAVTAAEPWAGGSMGVGLILKGCVSTNYDGDFWHGRFRKVTPGADIEGIEEPRRVPVKGEPAHA